MILPERAVLDDIVTRALAEDLGVDIGLLASGCSCESPAVLERDVTTSSVADVDAGFEGRIVAREPGVVCGLAAVERLYAVLAAAAGREGSVECVWLASDGDVVCAGDAVAEVRGDAAVLLAAERTALNLIMVLSGIATAARRWQDAAGPHVAVFDTRKTLPGLRTLSKWAVACGGAHPHRLGLWDMVLVKDNHVRLAGGIAAAVDKTRSLHPELQVEIEADTVEQAAEAARAGADIVLLDNMDAETMRTAVEVVRAASADRATRTLTEASGAITLERVAAVIATGVDRISTSAIDLALPLDFGFDEHTPADHPLKGYPWSL
ncbi:MAG: carboxylating nicotinate-nucleotide diphosphorylase [Coriobacteriia bacterium]|jgi:nicotinate-nucleotide pyrophosphorylase (carboxylating)|nr:carboxylating nicotinate-nucleotide diphosphorylase [Coriobacteriia bacterium]